MVAHSKSAKAGDGGSRSKRKTIEGMAPPVARCRGLFKWKNQHCEIWEIILASPKKTKKKKTALVICRDQKQFWTTQKQFWQWVRDGVIVKTQDQPLTGAFLRNHEELMVIVSNTVLNLAHPNHMREALLSRRTGHRK